MTRLEARRQQVQKRKSSATSRGPSLHTLGTPFTLRASRSSHSAAMAWRLQLHVSATPPAERPPPAPSPSPPQTVSQWVRFLKKKNQTPTLTISRGASMLGGSPRFTATPPPHRGDRAPGPPAPDPIPRVALPRSVCRRPRSLTIRSLWIDPTWRSRRPASFSTSTAPSLSAPRRRRTSTALALEPDPLSGPLARRIRKFSLTVLLPLAPRRRRFSTPPTSGPGTGPHLGGPRAAFCRTPLRPTATRRRRIH